MDSILAYLASLLFIALPLGLANAAHRRGAGAFLEWSLAVTGFLVAGLIYSLFHV